MRPCGAAATRAVVNVSPLLEDLERAVAEQRPQRVEQRGKTVLDRHFVVAHAHALGLVGSVDVADIGRMLRICPLLVQDKNIRKFQEALICSSSSSSLEILLLFKIFILGNLPRYYYYQLMSSVDNPHRTVSLLGLRC